jgi:hypothetical protein
VSLDELPHWTFNPSHITGALPGVSGRRGWSAASRMEQHLAIIVPPLVLACIWVMVLHLLACASGGVPSSMTGGSVPDDYRTPGMPTLANGSRGVIVGWRDVPVSCLE